jgi:hypothetical protein
MLSTETLEERQAHQGAGIKTHFYFRKRLGQFNADSDDEDDNFSESLTGDDDYEDEDAA